jgi:hypothetical protein
VVRKCGCSETAKLPKQAFCRQLERQKLHKGGEKKRGMHLSFQASQTDASRAEESFIWLHPSILKLHKDASEQEQSFRQNRLTQGSLQADPSRREEKR